MTEPAETARVLATRRVTAQALAWLWHARKCRTLVAEAGLDRGGRITTPWRGHWRCDLVGLCRTGTYTSQYVVEVKGTLADLTRERIPQKESTAYQRFNSKWHHEHWSRDTELWVATGDEKTGWRAWADVPEHWGIMVFSEDGSKLKVLRKAPKPGPVETAKIAGVFCDLSEVASSQLLPEAFSFRTHVPPWQRLLNHGPMWTEDRVWTRDNNQMEMCFYDDERAQGQELQHGDGDQRPRGPRGRGGKRHQG